MIDATHLRLLMGPWLYGVTRPSCQISSAVNVVTPMCLVCKKDGVVRMSKQDYYTLQRNRGHIQDDLPHISAPIREQLMTGTHPECWELMFAGDDDEPWDGEEVEYPADQFTIKPKRL